MRSEVYLCDYCRNETRYAADGMVEVAAFPEDGGYRAELHFCSLQHAAAALREHPSCIALVAAYAAEDE